MPAAENVMVRVPRELAERLDRLAEGTRESRSSLAVLALEEWLRDEERKRESILAGMRDVQAGRVIPDEKVRAWLDSWGTEHELPPPTCD